MLLEWWWSGYYVFQWDFGFISCNLHLPLLSFMQRYGLENVVNKRQYHQCPYPWFTSIAGEWKGTSSPFSTLNLLFVSLRYDWLRVIVAYINYKYVFNVRRVICASKNPTKIFFKAKFYFKSTSGPDSAAWHHKHSVCQYPVEDIEKWSNVWSRYFGNKSDYWQLAQVYCS